MYQYILYGLNISSSLEFPQLCKGNKGDEAEVVIIEGEIPEEVIQKMESRYYEIGKNESWFYNDTGKFYIAGGREIRYSLEQNADLHYARAYILGYAISMLLLQKGIMTIHCSAIKKNGAAVLFSGSSGAGKSTITTRYLNDGGQLAADDVLAVKVGVDGKLLGYPAFPYQKLCRDAIEREGISIEGLEYINEEKDKFLVPRKEQFDLQATEVKTMILLTTNKGEEVMVHAMQGLDKFMAIRENLFLRRLYGTWLEAPEIVKACLEIANKVEVYIVSRPIGINTLAQVKEKIDELLEVKTFETKENKVKRD